MMMAGSRPCSFSRRARLAGLLAALTGSIFGCVAQEPYNPQQTGGQAGKASTAGAAQGGALMLEPPGPGGSGGAAGAADSMPGVVDCKTSDQCAPPYPYCAVAIGRCVECVSSRNCAGTGRPYCDPNTGMCVTCLTNAHCPHTSPYCATAIGLCVECISTDNCGSVGLACDRETYRCVPSCDKNSDCASVPPTPYCDPQRNLCVECVGDQGCSAGAPHCNIETKSCVACLQNSDCGLVTPYCDDRKHTCVECLTNRDCQAGVSCIAGVCAKTM